MIEAGEIDSESSNIYFFLPSITDRSEDTNKYLKNVSTSPIDITQKQFDDSTGCSFNPAKLDLFGADKAVMSAAVIQCLRHINNISNSHFVRNGDAFLSQKEVEVPVDWIGDQKNVQRRAILKLSIGFFLEYYLPDKVWFIIFKK